MKITRLLPGGLTALAAIPLLTSIAVAGTLAVPEQTRHFALSPQDHYDQVLSELFIDLTVIGVVFSLVTLYFMFAYRRRHANDVGSQPKLTPQAVLGWLLIPSALFLADDLFLFAKAADLHEQYRNVPANALEIKVTAQMWSWSYEYPNGISTTNELVVPKDKPILLRMSSQDVIHSHFLQRYRVTEDVMPGRVTYEWFMPDQLGESVVTCREYCGTMHSGMYGKVRVVSPAEFESWMAANAPAKPAADAAPAPAAEAAASTTKQ